MGRFVGKTPVLNGANLSAIAKIFLDNEVGLLQNREVSPRWNGGPQPAEQRAILLE